MSIDKIVNALEASDPVAAVEPLLKEWRKNPNRLAAELLSQVSAQATEQRGRVEGSTREARGAAWDKLEKQKHPADVGALLEVLGTFPLEDARKRLTTLEERGDDPRIDLALADLMARPPQGWRGAGSLRFWSHALHVFGQHQDTRVRDRLPALEQQWQADRGNAIGRYLSALLPGLVKDSKQWSDGALPEADARRLAPFLARPVKRDVSLESVFAKPSDLAVRQVLADALVEAGDPRGEFINLQLSAKLIAPQRTRQAALLKQHGRDWLGPLDKVIHQSGLRFERGFPVAATAGSKSSSMRTREQECSATIGRPEWSTFEELDLEPWTGPRGALVCHEVMRSLRVLRGASPDVFRSPRHLALEDVSFRGHDSPEDVKVVFSSKRTPKLRRLRIWPYTGGEENDAAAWAPLWQTPVMLQLEELTVNSPNRSANEWFQLVERAPKNVKKLSVEASSGEPWALVFTRADGEWAVELRYGWNSNAHEDDYRALDGWLSKVKRKFPQVTLDFVRSKEEPSKALRQALERTFKKRLGAAEVAFLEPTARVRAGRR